MKSAPQILIFVLIALLFSACAEENRWDCFTGMGDIQSEVRILPPFESIYTQDRIDLEYRFDSAYFIEITFGENLLEHIQTEVIDGQLRLENTAKCNWVRDLSIKPSVVLYAPHFSHIENRGTGHIDFLDTLNVASFTYEEYEANGAVNLLLNCAESNILLHTGRCNVQVLGRSETSNLYSSGVGQMNASGLLSATALVNNSSPQPMRVHSNGYLFAFIGRQGSICYTGSPDLIEVEREGSGALSACSD